MNTAAGCRHCCGLLGRELDVAEGPRGLRCRRGPKAIHPWTTMRRGRGSIRHRSIVAKQEPTKSALAHPCTTRRARPKERAQQKWQQDAHSYRYEQGSQQQLWNNAGLRVNRLQHMPPLRRDPNENYGTMLNLTQGESPSINQYCAADRDRLIAPRTSSWSTAQKNTESSYSFFSPGVPRGLLSRQAVAA